MTVNGGGRERKEGCLCVNGYVMQGERERERERERVCVCIIARRFGWPFSRVLSVWVCK